MLQVHTADVPSEHVDGTHECASTMLDSQTGTGSLATFTGFSSMLLPGVLLMQAGCMLAASLLSGEHSETVLSSLELQQ